MSSVIFSIARNTIYSTDGAVDTTVYEIRATDSDGIVETVTLERPEDVIALRDALTSYINDNNLYAPRNDDEQR